MRYATFLGKRGTNAIAVDSKGQAWIVGTACLDTQVCTAASSYTSASTVIKLDANGAKALVDNNFGGGYYSRAYPVPFTNEALGVAVDGSDSAWVVGHAASYVPTTPGAQRSIPLLGIGASIGYIVHFSPSGDLLYGSYAGSTAFERVPSVAVDAQDNVYFAPTGVPLFASCGFQYSSLVKVLSSDGAQVLASRYVKSPVQSLAHDGRGGFYAVGETTNYKFFTTVGVYQPSYPMGAVGSAFAAKLDFSTPIRPELMCVVNAANGVQQAIAPGEIVTLAGSGFTPASVVNFDGHPAPVLYADATQIKAVVPFEVTGSMSRVSVDSGSASADLPVAPAMPGLFAVPAQANYGQAVALNEDGTRNSSANPAKAGSVITVYVTDAGLMTPSLMDGQLGPLQAPYPAPALGLSMSVVPYCSPYTLLSVHV